MYGRMAGCIQWYIKYHYYEVVVCNEIYTELYTTLYYLAYLAYYSYSRYIGCGYIDYTELYLYALMKKILAFADKVNIKRPAFWNRRKINMRVSKT